ncbi:MAG: tRNA(Ile)(2)-agmatinylcytidine synthase [Methanomicrobiales archaeon]|nr:tRNA(Ile)(2)-agmatinylcytidine synthase [Methanomicrobiales archaeon]
MLIGIDDTDSPRTMCTTYLAARLIQSLREHGYRIHRAFLVRLNPNVTWKTRGNAAIAIEADGDVALAFDLACRWVEALADFGAEETHPGVVVVQEKPPAAFYYQAARDFCSIDEAVTVLTKACALFKGYKSGRGLIGATAAVCAELPDVTFELLVYRTPDRWGTARHVEKTTLFTSEADTYPHTWDSVDTGEDSTVCVPHTPDPVLFGIRGESPFWVARGRSFIFSEEPACEQVFLTNQGTDAHLVPGTIGHLEEGRSYLLEGVVSSPPKTGKGGHVGFGISGRDGTIHCMAYEPTKRFRDVVRALLPGDRLIVVGSWKQGSINLEKMCILSLVEWVVKSPPLCGICGKRMTSAGTDKGYKCRNCRTKSKEPQVTLQLRLLRTGWYEVPPCARRHLAKPLVRGAPSLSPTPVIIGMSIQP